MKTNLRNGEKKLRFLGNTVRQRNSKRMKSKDKAGETKVEKRNLRVAEEELGVNRTRKLKVWNGGGFWCFLTKYLNSLNPHTNIKK